MSPATIRFSRSSAIPRRTPELTTAAGLPIAPLLRRVAASLLNMALGIASMAVAGEAAVALDKVGVRLPSRLRSLFAPNCDAGDAAAFKPSRATRDMLETVGLVNAVLMRNSRSPGARIMHIRRVDARTGGPVSVRSAIIRSLAAKAWGSLVAGLFTRFERRVQARFQTVNEQLRELRVKHAADKEALQRAQIELFKRYNVNPLASCGWILPGIAVGQLPRLFSPLHQTLPDRIAGVVIVKEPSTRQTVAPGGG
jgi:hypothetical protein